MRFLIVRLVVTVSIPLITGVAFVLSIFYQSLWHALDQWEQDSLLWIDSTQKQILYNSVFSMQYIEQRSFTQIQLHLVITNNLIQKYYKKIIRTNPSSRFLKCSYRELVLNKCPQEIYEKLKQSIFYLDLYFVRETFQFGKLTPQQQDFIVMNEFISYYGRAAILASLNNELLKIQTFYNSDTTSILAHIPSRYENFTNSDYEKCFEDNFEEPFDPRCRSWYIYAQQHEGYFFYEPYIDAIEGNLEMTISSQITNDSEIVSINSIDLEMSLFVELFKSSISENSYPVLFHEFNNTVFYHPQLIGSNLTSWVDLEFQNTTKCDQAKLEACNTEKQNFSQLLNQTVVFIQKENYSILGNINTDNLYQYWTRQGIKKISLVYPVNSQITKYKTQQPYSNAIILTAKVMNDASDSLKLFNILDLQNPIELLIQFLQYSLKQQQHFNEQFTQKKQKTNNQLPSTQKKILSCKKMLNKSDYDEKNYLEGQKSFFSFHQNDINSQIIIKSRFNKSGGEEQHLQQSKMKLLNRKNIDEIDQTIEKSDDSYDFSKTYDVKNKLNNQNIHDLRIRLHKFNENLIFDSISGSYQSQDHKIGNNKILQGLKPLFLEMKIIKKTFQMLESVLNYQVDTYSKDSNNINSLFHFTKAKSTFQQLKNQTGVCRCYFNLGIIQLLNQEYDLACQYFESAIYQNLSVIDIDSFNNIQEKLLQNLQNQTEEQLFIFCKRIFTLAYTSKQFSFKTIQNDQDLNKLEISFDHSKLISDRDLTNQYSTDLTKMSQTSHQYLKKSLELYKILEKIILRKNKCFSKIFKIYLNLEISEILIQLNKLDSIPVYFQNINQLLQKLTHSPIKNIQSKTYLEKKILEEKYIFYQDDSTNSANIVKKNQEQSEIVLEILRSKFYYLQGLKEKKIKNYYISSLLLTQCLEEGTHFSPFLRNKAIQCLKEIFKINQLEQQDYLTSDEIQYKEKQTPYDIVILIQVDCIIQTSTYESCLESIKKLNFIKPNDRVQAIIFHEELSNCIPLTKIQSDHHWQLMIDCLKLSGRDIFCQQQENRQQINWQQALQSTFDYFYDLNIEDFSNLNQICKQINVNIQQENQSKKRQKCILLFSKQQSSKQISTPQKLVNIQSMLLHDKPLVFHLKECLQQRGVKQVNEAFNIQAHHHSFLSYNNRSCTSFNFILQQSVGCFELMGRRQPIMDKFNIKIDSTQFCFFLVNNRIAQLQSTLITPYCDKKSYKQILLIPNKKQTFKMILIFINLAYYLNKVNKNSQFLKCSYQELVHKQCPQSVYSLLNQSTFYVDLYFARENYQFDKLTTQQQDFIIMNEFISFYGRAAIVASINNDLLKIQTIYNSDTTSILAHIPSRYENFTDSDYEDCLGKNFTEPYDPRCRPWYQYAQQHKGYFFYEPYLDAIENNLVMTLSSQIDYNSEFKSVSSIDFEMNSIVQLYKTSVTQTDYSVLFHEFNNTVFYHPSLKGSNLTSWVDLEFQNMTSNFTELQNDCLLEKQKFSQMLDSTVQFIKNGKFSIDQDINTSQLYQFWTRNNQKQISIVLPVQSQISKYNTQQPYSNAIILTARIVSDKSDTLKLFNILNFNIIQIPYGLFQIYQVQQPIELLKVFLENSLKQQQQCNSQVKEKKQNVINPSFIISKKLQSKQRMVKIQQDKNILDSQKQSQILMQKNINNISKSKFNIKNGEESQIEQSKIRLLNRKTFDDFAQIVEQFSLSSTNQKYQNIPENFTFEFNQNAFSPISNKNFSRNKNIFDLKDKLQKCQDEFSFCQKSQIKQHHESKEIYSDKILHGLKPLFLEMKIIKKTFQMLESVINYQIDAYTRDSKDTANSLFHFTKAKTTFQKLKNQTGVCRCYFNLGIIYLMQQEYQLASEYFESAIYLNLEIIGIDTLYNIDENIFLNLQNLQEDQLFIFCKRIISLAHSLKQRSIQIAQDQRDINIKQEMNCFEQSQQFLHKSLDLYQIIEKIICNNNKYLSQTLKIYIHLEIIEILILLGKLEQVEYYFIKVNQFIKRANYFSKNTLSKIFVEKRTSKEQIKQFYDETVYSINASKTLKQFSNSISQDLSTILLGILESKLKFLLGLSEKSKQNYYQASVYFTQSLEEGSHYNPFLRKRALLNLREIFQINNIQSQDLVYEQMINEGDNDLDAFDVVILIQLDCIINYSTYEACLEDIKKSKFFKQNDKIQFLIFHKDISICIPFTPIQSDHHWQFMIDSLKQFGWQMLYQQGQSREIISNEQALLQSIFLSQNQTIQDILKLRKIHKIGLEQFYFEDFHYQRKKIILMFSKQLNFKQNYLQQQLLQLQQPPKLQNIKVFHLRESIIQEGSNQLFQCKNVIYESFSDENKFVSNIIKLRNNINFKEEYEYITILNNS
ncbi:hypothetical protein ABPG74_018088 [Tetrahymena malaccensis]